MQRLTGDVGELVLQRADVCNVDVEERAELGHGHPDAGDGDVGQAAAAVHWRSGKEKLQITFRLG